MRACINTMYPLFLNALATGLGRGGEGNKRFPLRRVDTSCNIAGTICGADLLRSPHFGQY